MIHAWYIIVCFQKVWVDRAKAKKTLRTVRCVQVGAPKEAIPAASTKFLSVKEAEEKQQNLAISCS